MNAKQSYLRIVVLLTMLIGLAVIAIGPYMGPMVAHLGIAQATGITPTTSINHASTPVPFMHRPYYGNLTVAQRTTSFVDHDKPWYGNDGIFVR